MNKSDSIAALAKALAAAQKEYKPIPKNKTAKVQTKTGGSYSYKYADLADVISVISPTLADHGLSVVQPMTESNGTLRVSTVILHESGEWISSDGIKLNEGADPQVFGGQLSYFRRYDYCSMTGVMPDEDTDGVAASADAKGISGFEHTSSKPTAPAKPSSTPRPAAKPQPARQTATGTAPANGKPAVVADEPKQEAKPEAPKSEQKEQTVHEKLTAKVKEIWNDPKVGANGAQLKEFVLKGTNAKTLNDLKPEEAEGAYNALTEAQEKGTIKSLLGVK